MSSSPLSENNIIYESEDKDKEEPISEIELVPEEELLPEKIDYDVPFTAQAPFGNWDDIFRILAVKKPLF